MLIFRREEELNKMFGELSRAETISKKYILQLVNLRICMYGIMLKDCVFPIIRKKLWKRKDSMAIKTEAMA